LAEFNGLVGGEDRVAYLAQDTQIKKQIVGAELD
jgi:hypothetical protein